MSLFNDSDVSDGDYDANTTYPEAMDEMCIRVNATMPTPNVMRFVIYGVLLTIVGLLGLAGNFISITVLSRCDRAKRCQGEWEKLDAVGMGVATEG